MKQAILELIDRKINKSYGTLKFNESNLLEELRSEIEKMEEWIPVTERLPERNMRCMIFASYQPDFAFFVVKEGKFYKCGTNEEYYDVEFWSKSPMVPLPPNK